jgi:hypothetical protein
MTDKTVFRLPFARGRLVWLNLRRAIVTPFGYLMSDKQVDGQTGCGADQRPGRRSSASASLFASPVVTLIFFIVG